MSPLHDFCFPSTIHFFGRSPYTDLSSYKCTNLSSKKMLYYFHKSEFDIWLPYFSRALIMSCWNNRYASVYHLKSSYTASILCVQVFGEFSSISAKAEHTPGRMLYRPEQSFLKSQQCGGMELDLNPTVYLWVLGPFQFHCLSNICILNPKTLLKIKLYMGVQDRKQIQAEILLWLKWAKESRVWVGGGWTSLPPKSSS